MVEMLFLLIALVGVGMWSVPAALVLAGVLGVVAAERAQAQRKGTTS
ncbi:hypothetical protein [Streptomyces sp. NPDC057557]